MTPEDQSYTYQQFKLERMGPATASGNELPTVDFAIDPVADVLVIDEPNQLELRSLVQEVDGQIQLFDSLNRREGRVGISDLTPEQQLIANRELQAHGGMRNWASALATTAKRAGTVTCISEMQSAETLLQRYTTSPDAGMADCPFEEDGILRILEAIRNNQFQIPADTLIPEEQYVAYWLNQRHQPLELAIAHVQVSQRKSVEVQKARQSGTDVDTLSPEAQGMARVIKDRTDLQEHFDRATNGAKLIGEAARIQSQYTTTGLLLRGIKAIF